MIDYLRDWVVNIAAAVICIAIIEIIMPSEKFKKYIKLVTGLVLMIIIINPVIAVINKNYIFDGDVLQSFAEENIKNSSEKSSENLKTLQEKQIVETYRQKAAEYIKNIVEKDKEFTVSDILLKFVEDQKSQEFGKILEINITLRNIKRDIKISISKPSQNDNADQVQLQKVNQIKQNIKKQFDIPEDKILIEIQK